MSNLFVVCVLAGSLAYSQATFMKLKYPVKQVCCYDNVGHRIEAGQRYFDGCNTCTCGNYGQPTFCTRKFCGSKLIDSIKPIYTMKKKKHVYTITPKIVKPVVKVIQKEPVHHVHVVKSVQKERPVISVKPVYQIQPVKVVKEVYVVNQVDAVQHANRVDHVYPVEQIKPMYPVNDVNLVYRIEQVQLVNPVHELNNVYPIEHIKTAYPTYKAKHIGTVHTEDD